MSTDKKTYRDFGIEHKTPSQRKAENVRLKKQWTKQQTILGFQQFILSLSRETIPEKQLFAKCVEQFFKMCGYYAPDIVNSTTNNVLVVTKERNDALWQQRLAEQQRNLVAQTKMAADTKLQSRTGN